MDDFVDCDLGETLPENESIDIFDDEPPAKKKRGANLKYIFIEEAESYDDLKEKATNAGLKFKQTPSQSAFYILCKKASCCYKWKAKKTDDSKYLIYETDDGDDHGDAEKKSGLTKEMKDVLGKRMEENERVNAGAVIQAFLHYGITSLPTSKQINNFVNSKKKLMKPSGEFYFVDFSNMVTDIKETESELVEFKYQINEECPSKTDREYLQYYNDLENEMDAGDIELFQKNNVAVTRSTLFENEFTCNCRTGAVRTRCKHVLLIQVICNHREFPDMPALRQTIIMPARTGPGRPRGHTQALSRN